MPELEHDDGSLDGYRLPGIYGYVAAKQIDMVERPDPRVNLVDGPARDALIEEDRHRCATDPAYRRGKAVYDINRIEAGLPFLILRRTIDTRPIHPNEPPGRMAWPEARLWPEIRERSVAWFELHPDDRLVPVHGEADPETYWTV